MTTTVRMSQVCPDNSSWYLGNLVSFLVSGADTDGRIALIQTCETRGREPPRHIHHHEDEIIYVLEGHLQFSVGETCFDAPRGTYVLLPRGIEHGFTLASEEAKLLLMLTPAGLEGYFKELSRPVGQLHALPDAEQLVTTAARYGVEITGPP